MNYFGWIDFSRKDRDLARDIIASLNEPGAVDELGIGVIRDAFADCFFPGTSTIQTIAKYFFIVSYLLEDLTGNPASDYEQELRKMEKKCSLAMWNNLSPEERKSGSTGVFGSTFFGKSGESPSREWVKRTPSIVYWGGIRKLNFLICPNNTISLAEFLRMAAAREPIPEDPDDEPENRPAGSEKSWHWCLPPPEGRGNWKDNPTVRLTPQEARFFVEQIDKVIPETLFAFIAERRRNLPEKFSDLRGLNLPPHLLEQWQLANDFSEFLKPAQIRFNCLLNNEKAGQMWPGCPGENLHQLASAVKLDEIFTLLKIDEKHRKLRKFLETLQSKYLSGSIDELDKLLFEREKSLKGAKRMKLKQDRREVDPRYRENWVGGLGLEYRYPDVCRLLRDVVKAEEDPS